MAAFFTFIGRLHPVLVHLPIGVILLALLLEYLSGRPKYAGMKPAADLTLGLGVLCAIASCCTGLLLSHSGDYDQDLVNIHMWLAIGLTVITAVLYGKLNGRAATRDTKLLSAASLVLIFLTGHFGGSLTHGPGYLTTDLSPKPPVPALHPVADVQHAVVYTEMVQPVLHDNCYGCHSAGHVKGGLRLDAPDNMLKGGKDGAILTPGASLLMKRILLPLDDDHHMAPKEKPQLTTAEVKLLKWWIANGASFDKQVAQIPQSGDIQTVLAAFHDGTAGPTSAGNAPSNVADSDMPGTPVKPAPAEVVKRLAAAGALVLPISTGSNYLTVSFPNDTIGRDALAALPLIREQLVELKCSDLPVGDEIINIAAASPHLVRLWLDHTRITGKPLGQLDTLAELRYLNLTGTAVDEAAVRTLTKAKKLKEIFLYQTNVPKSSWPALQAAFPHTLLDSGGYQLPKLTTDTAVVRPAPQKK
ncbi:MAG TPA: DUF2231 domain-containing protein [Puia sp.]|nr:DUF2231 domain-containing protein [Puia sp.]